MPKIKQAQSTGEILALGLGVVLVQSLIMGLFYGWILMLLLGTLHHDFSASIPAVGYWLCFWPAVLFRILIGQTNTSTTNK